MLTREQAIQLAESGWWKGLPPEAIAAFQLYEDKLCMPFGDFHAAVQASLGRPVFTHEISDVVRLRDEFMGVRPKATLEEVLDMIPESKRIIVVEPPDAD